MIKTINPATGETLNSYSEHSILEIDEIIINLKEQQSKWRKTKVENRINCIKNIKRILLEKCDSYAIVITNEMGKPFKESIAEIKKCISLCEFYINHGENFLKDQNIELIGVKAKRIFQPLGIIYTIMPWNFPFWQVLRSIIPSILLGNVVILKHAENVIESGYRIEYLIHESTGLSILKNIVINFNLSEYIIKHPMVSAVTFTGSNKVGSIIARQAGEVCKKVILELGGSDAYIIRKDVNIKEVADHIVKTRMLNAGQVCISPKRLIVDKSIQYDFEKEILESVHRIKMGDPFNPEYSMGPLAKYNVRDNLDNQVKKSIQQGAKLIYGGHIIKEQPNGLYYSPTILTNVTTEMVAFKEELFGPVIVITISENDDHAIQLVNTSIYGLGGGIFTNDIPFAKKVAKYHIESGMCFINQCVSSHPALPFGGIKQSGYGRECSVEALRELANIKTILIR